MIIKKNYKDDLPWKRFTPSRTREKHFSSQLKHMQWYAMIIKKTNQRKTFQHN